MMSKTIYNSIIGTVIAGILAWGVWVTTGTYASCETSKNNKELLHDISKNQRKDIQEIRSNQMDILKIQKQDNQKIMEMLMKIQNDMNKAKKE